MTLFKVGGPVVGKDFYGREKVLEMLYKDLVKRGKLGYVIYGPRRIGKTSLLEEFVNRVKKKSSATPVYFDVSSLHPFDIESFHDQLFLKCVDAFRPKREIKSRLIEALKGSGEALAALLRSTEVGVSIKDYLQVKVSFKEKKASLQDLIKKSFGVAESLGRETKSRAILIFDEFQMVEELEKNTVWAIRAIIQRWKNTSIIVCGSEVSLLEQMALPKTAPFFHLLKPYQLGPFDETTSVKMMREKFRKAGLSFTEEHLKKIHHVTEGYPYYLQWLGDKIYDSEKKEITEAVIEDSLKVMLAEGDAVFRSSLEKLSAGEKSVLIEIGLGNENMSGIARKIGKPLPNIAKMIERLIEKSYVKKKAVGKYVLVDPMLKRWITATYGA
ncbi:MAG: ATP-binding protein [Candidatus Bilamarchaeaceae archaeon]